MEVTQEKFEEFGGINGISLRNLLNLHGWTEKAPVKKITKDDFIGILDVQPLKLNSKYNFKNKIE